MALISNAKGRGENETPSGYERLFGNRQLGMLMSKVQSAVISTGNELEGMLASQIKDTKGISIQKINKEDRVFKGIKDGHDIIIDCVVAKEGKFMLIEIKDGDTFDANVDDSFFSIRDKFNDYSITCEMQREFRKNRRFLQEC